MRVCVWAKLHAICFLFWIDSGGGEDDKRWLVVKTGVRFATRNAGAPNNLSGLEPFSYLSHLLDHLNHCKFSSYF